MSSYPFYIAEFICSAASYVYRITMGDGVDLSILGRSSRIRSTVYRSIVLCSFPFLEYARKRIVLLNETPSFFNSFLDMRCNKMPTSETLIRDMCHLSAQKEH